MSFSVAVHKHLSDFDLALEFLTDNSRVTGLYGHSGSGKSRLLALMAGFDDECTQLSVCVDDCVWDDKALNQHLPVHQRALGVVFQQAELFSHLSVRGNLDYAKKRAKNLSSDDEEKILSALGVKPLLDKAPFMLSGGERQRVVLARAFFNKPRYLFLDEPLSAVDEQARLPLAKAIKALLSYFSIQCIYVTHSLVEMTYVADHLLVLEKGQLVYNGDVLNYANTQQMLHDEPFTLLEGAVVKSDFDEYLSTFQAGYIKLYLPHDLSSNDTDIDKSNKGNESDESNENKKNRVRVYAKDISLSLQPVTDSSILNILPVRITQLIHDAGQVWVEAEYAEHEEYAEINGEEVKDKIVDVKSQKLLAKITAYSAAKLNIAVGMPVYFQLKALSLLDA